MKKFNRIIRAGTLTFALFSITTSAMAIIFNDPFPDPEIPEDQLPPAAPTPYVFNREANQISVRITDINDNENGYYIQRQINNGSWVTIASIGALSNSSYTRIDNGRASDTYHCYRSRAYNQNGTTTSSKRCAYTKDGNDNEVWRVQLELSTSNVSDANTDDSLYVRLNSSASTVQPSRNRTWMDYGRDDFERGDVFAYDLDLGNVAELGDITQIFIGKSGSNGWCVQDLSLKVNNIEVFIKNFSSEPSGCKWLDNDNGHVNYLFVNHAELRAHSKWSNYNENAAMLLLAVNGIDNEEMTSRIESLVGDQIHGEDLYWGHLHGDAVEVTYGCAAGTQNCTTLHVDLDLAADVNNLPDPEVDIDFDITFQCGNGSLSITTSNFNVNVDSSWIYELLSIGLINFLDGEVESRIENAWEQIAQDIDGVPDCNVFVNEAGDVFLEAAENTDSGSTSTGSLPTFPAPTTGGILFSL